MSGPVPVRWDHREPPLAPVAVAAVGESAVRLLHLVGVRLSRELAGEAAGLPTGEPGARAGGPSGIQRLSGVWARAGRELVVVLMGEAEQLPWVEGVVYLGRDPLAPQLLLPTLRIPKVPLEVYAAAVRSRVATDGLVACLQDGTLLLPVISARPLGRNEIRSALK